LLDVVQVERVQGSDIQVTCHGSVKSVIEGTIPAAVTAAACDCRATRHGIACGSPDGRSSMGEALVVNGIGYCRSADASAPHYLQTRSGPALTAGRYAPI